MYAELTLARFICSQCGSIDYFYVAICTNCTQATMDGCALGKIRSKDSHYHFSLYLAGCPRITSLVGLSKLSGALQGAVRVSSMHGLKTLDGLEKVRSVGTDVGGVSIYLSANPNLQSASALDHIKYKGNTLHVNQNPRLKAVPHSWPATKSPTAQPTVAPTPAPTDYYLRCSAAGESEWPRFSAWSNQCASRLKTKFLDSPSSMMADAP